MMLARYRFEWAGNIHNKLISFFLFASMAIWGSGCSAFGASYEIDAETENTGWVRSILTGAKFLNKGRKIYRFSSDNVSFVVCGFRDAWKTIAEGPPLVPVIPSFKESKTKNLVVYLVVKNPGVELKVNFQGIRVELAGGRTYQYGSAAWCVTQTDDEDICYCSVPKDFYRR